MAQPIYEGSVWKVLSPLASLKTRIEQARRQAERVASEEEAMRALPAHRLEGLEDDLETSLPLTLVVSDR